MNTVCIFGIVAAVCAAGTEPVPLYGTYERTLSNASAFENPFEVFAHATFSDGVRSFNVDGFHDGGHTWRVRFMPDRTGPWTYTWSLGGSEGRGEFLVEERADPINHGHVHRDAIHTRYLVHDDGTPHYWFGGKWVGAPAYAPADATGIRGEESEAVALPDATILGYLDTMAAKRHNGLLIKMALFPLLDDGITWDLAWIRRAEWCVREMGNRGIYCQVSIFDTWSRKKGAQFEYTTNGPEQVFNVWAAGDEPKKQNYLRTLVARFAGFYNVYWELGNEMEHAPNSGERFTREANSKYLPWIRGYDPYGLPIGVSETGVWAKADVDIGFMHQTHTFPEAGAPYDRPTIMNELVFGWEPANLYEDQAIRDPGNRFGYRRTFWRMFCAGGSGCSQATWLDIREPLNEAVAAVMNDQHRLRDFLEALPVDLNETLPLPGFVESGPGSSTTRGKTGTVYISYFHVGPGATAPKGEVRVAPAPGSYSAAWLDPKTGDRSADTKVSASGPVTLTHEAFAEDRVLLLRAVVAD